METSNSFQAKTASTPFYHKDKDDSPQKEAKFYKTTYRNEKAAMKKKALASLSVLSSNIGNCRYPGLSEFQSESSMQHSSYCWTIPRQLRFESKSDNKNGSIYTLPSMKMARTTTLGFGLRRDMRPTYGLNTPSPAMYNISTCFDSNMHKRKGVTIRNKPKEAIDDTRKFPGPGTYMIPTSMESDIPITIKPRRMFFYDDDIRKKKYTVSMQRYSPSLKLVQRLRYSAISFGLGKRTPNENISIMRNPGPGAYNIAGIFDRGIKNKAPLN